MFLKIPEITKIVIKYKTLALVEKITRSGCEQDLAHTYIEEQTDTDKVRD